MTPETENKPTTFLELVRAREFEEKALNNWCFANNRGFASHNDAARWQFDRDKAQAETLAALLDKAWLALGQAGALIETNISIPEAYPGFKAVRSALAEIESERMKLKGEI